MKKFTLLTTATLLTAAGIGCTTLTADAAPFKMNTAFRYGNSYIITNGSLGNCINQENLNISMGNCDIDSLLEQILQCRPSQFPCPPTQAPDIETPDSEHPDSETPDVEIESPDTNQPDYNTPGTPESGKPETESGTPETEVPEDNENLSFVEQVVNLVNAERAKEGLAPLSVDKNVQAAAQIRAIECEQSFSHTRPNGSSFSTALKEQNVSYKRAGENIAWGQRSPEEVVNAWMNSSGHRANIMNASFTKIGVGYYRNARGVNYWSQLFIG